MKNLRFGLALFAGFILPCSIANAHEDNGKHSFILNTNADYAEKLTSTQEDVNSKTLVVLKGRKDGQVETGKIYISAGVTGEQIWEKTDVSGKYPILSRLPDQHPAGLKNNRSVLTEAALAITATPTDWLSVVFQGEYIDTTYPGQAEYQLTRAYAILGDLSTNPYYLMIGRNTIDFGDLDSYNPYTHNDVTHYFWPVSTDPIITLGYVDDGLEASITAISGHRQQRVADAPDTGALVPNFAANVSKTMYSGLGWVKIGASYLHGTIYDTAVTHHTAQTAPADKIRNGAYDIYAEAHSEKFDIRAEYASTLKNWPATNAKARAATIMARYHSKLFDKTTRYSAVCSRGFQGEKDSVAYQMSQCVLGADLDINKNTSIGAEYLYNKGFVPLINPLVTGNQGVDSQTFIVGTRLRF
jgi:hypothetical protein